MPYRGRRMTISYQKSAKLKSAKNKGRLGTSSPSLSFVPSFISSIIFTLFPATCSFCLFNYLFIFLFIYLYLFYFLFDLRRYLFIFVSFFLPLLQFTLFYISIYFYFFVSSLLHSLSCSHHLLFWFVRVFLCFSF